MLQLPFAQFPALKDCSELKKLGASKTVVCAGREEIETVCGGTGTGAGARAGADATIVCTGTVFSVMTVTGRLRGSAK